MLSSIFKWSTKIYHSALNKNRIAISNSLLKLSYLFSAPKYHPTIQKIISGQALANIDPILSEISSLGSQDHQTALKLILKNVYSHKLSHQTLMNSRFVSEAKKHPEIYIDSSLFKIKVLIGQLDQLLSKGQLEQHREKLASTFREIDASFKACFEEFKKIPKEQALRTGIMINKRYADYYLLYLVGVTEKAQEKEAVLKKITQVYRNIIVEMAKLINQEGQRVQMIEQLPLNEKQTKQQREFKLNSMKESIKTVVESNSENIMHMFKSTNELFKLNRDQKSYVEGVLEIISYIDRGLAYYSILRDMSLYSIFYSHLRKIKAELTYYYKSYKLRETQSAEKGTQKQQLHNEFMKQLDEVYKEAAQNLQKISEEEKYLSNVKQIALLMLSIRSQMIEKQKLDVDELKNKLLIEVQAISEKISSASNRKSTMEKLVSGVKLIVRNEQANKKIGDS